jgi:TetR/AcrR family acrAB operon transcriptional repressor
MARRTKEDALATRHQLLDAAEHVFAEKGVSRSCLNDIAQAAGVSRGAIYWHFKNKADLFNAMLERITLPMEQALHQIGDGGARDPLDALRCAILDALQKIATDARTRRVFEVATHKVEYIDELLVVKARQVKVQSDVVCQMQHSLLEACARRAQPLPIPAVIAAQGLHALVAGLIDSWLLAPEAFDLVAVADLGLQAYLAGLGLVPVPYGTAVLPPA